MEYEVHIQDRDNLEDILILEYAERNSIILNWLGGDDKTQAIVGSELNFSMEVLDGADGKYIQYFTSDEQKWRVTKYIAGTQTIVWRGFLLPESYSEPWANPTFYPQFSAVDGLGLLKGKKLTDDFYEEEKTPIEIISACLQLTGIDFDIYFSPAIQNTVVSEWHKIYTDTRKWFKKDKLPSAYDILNDVVHSLRCQLFQAEGRWYIEGINKRHLPNVTFYKYSIAGEYLGTIDVTKQIKDVNWTPYPMITMVPSLKEVIVEHDGEKVEVKEEVYKQNNIEWRKAPGVVLEILPHYWDYSANCIPVMKAPEYYLEIPYTNYSGIEGFLATRIDLKERLFFIKDSLIDVKVEFEIVGGLSSGIDLETVVNTNIYAVVYNDVYLAWSHYTEKMALEYNADGKASSSFQFLTTEDGFLDIALFPSRDYNIRLMSLSVELKNDEDSVIYTEEVDPLSSQVREIDLEISDDISGISKSFYLEKQREFSENEYFKIQAPILYSFTQNGNNYHVVSLKHANLIEQFIDFVTWSTRFTFLENLEVIYNFNGGEQMVVKADALMTGAFYVQVRKYKAPTGNRIDWLRWTDSVYKAEEKTYIQVVAEIEKKLFTNPHLRIEASAQAPIKYNDLIKFSYRTEDKYFIATNVSWNPDDNESGVTLVEGVYAGNSLGNIPPYVNAGPDLYINQGATTAQITEAVANDPNGSISSVLWEQISGTGATFSNAGALNPKILNISDTITEYRLTATDNEGASASDTMKVFIVGNFILVLELIDTYQDIPTPVVDNSWLRRRDTYKVYTTPLIDTSETITLNIAAKLYRYLENAPRNDEYSGRVLIRKNGVEIYDLNRTYRTRQKEVIDEDVTNTINYIVTDNMELVIETMLIANTAYPTDTVSAELNFTGAIFKNTSAQLTNLPYGKSITMTMADYV